MVGRWAVRAADQLARFRSSFTRAVMSVKETSHQGSGESAGVKILGEHFQTIIVFPLDCKLERREDLPLSRQPWHLLRGLWLVGLFQ